MQEPQLRPGIEFLQHAWHRGRNWQPLVDQQWLINAHADQENDEVALEARRESTAMNHGLQPKGMPKNRAMSGAHTARLCVRERGIYLPAFDVTIGDT